MTCNDFVFVIDMLDNKLAPTKESKAFYLIRKGRAKMVNKYPMVIRLLRIVEEVIQPDIILGIDDGSKYVGIGIVQRTTTYDKPILKGTIQLRRDVSKKMTLRKGYRHNRRKNKRYRPKRFNNRASSKRKGRLPPSIKHRKDSILRVVDRIDNFVDIKNIILEDVKFDIRALTDGYKPYKFQYSKSNRLDGHIRTAVLMRDNYTCQLCGMDNRFLEVHHIIPRRNGGNSTINNLITLCNDCHRQVSGNEDNYTGQFYNKIKGKSVNLKDPMHVMQGKKYLQKELSKRSILSLTTGADTTNKRKDRNIEKSHSNDALCIASNNIRNTFIDEWSIKPLRSKKKGDYTKETSNGLKLGDYVEYKPKSGNVYKGYVGSITSRNNAINVETLDKTLKKISCNSCTKLYSPNKQLWAL